MIKIGDTYEMLTVLSPHTKKLYGESAWVCACDCGETTLATTGQIIRGEKKSCGCLRKKTPANALDLSGKRFGKLTVIERSGATKGGSALWRCRCDCGTDDFVANATSLRRGETVSCGCLRPEQAANAREILANDYTVDGVQVPLLTKKVRSDSGTGHKGVHKRVRKGREYYEAYITVNGKRKYLGMSTELGKAISMRRRAEEEYYSPYIKALGERNGQQRD
ncbi:hypothetical protein [Paenibacillus campinasensis]|uniref:AP2 domain-containing protein n=1 Tax=Paenibacillus campinasensis TaxID=66347 RepID=A0A268EH16_9BACL|nr:hypothetical protein [Paenibacillus campinasensis]PAD72435.1 hypothetical protein CHH67_22605 [Paenibacillus campinasensis]